MHRSQVWLGVLPVIRSSQIGQGIHRISFSSSETAGRYGTLTGVVHISHLGGDLAEYPPLETAPVCWDPRPLTLGDRCAGLFSGKA